MSYHAPIVKAHDWYIGADHTFDFFAFTGPPIVVANSTNSGLTAVPVLPLEDALGASAVVVFRIQRPPGLPDYFAATTLTGAGAAAGATSLPLAAALPFNLRSGQAGRLPLAMTGYTLEWVVRDRPGAAAALFTVPDGDITIGNGFATGDKASVPVADSDTLALAPGKKYHTLRRTTDGSETVLAYGAALLQEAATR